MRDNRPQIHQFPLISVLFCFTTYLYIGACYLPYAMFWRVWTFQLVHIQRLTPKLLLTMFVDLGLQPKRPKVKLHEPLSVYKADLHNQTWPLFYSFFFIRRQSYSKFFWAAWSTTSLRIISPRWSPTGGVFMLNPVSNKKKTTAITFFDNIIYWTWNYITASFLHILHFEKHGPDPWCV